MTFETLGLSPAILRALADHHYTTPTPVQAEAIPLALAGRDLLGSAQTGTGKTAAFALPILQRLFANQDPNARNRKVIRALILTPTRELAVQVNDSIRGYAKHMRLQVSPMYGGSSMRTQFDELRRGIDILVATPGRLMDHMQRRSVDLSNVEILVLDEADRMLEPPYIGDTCRRMCLA